MSFFGDLFAGKAAQEAANYNARIIETNKKAKLAEANRIMSVHNDYNLPKFDKTVEEIQGTTKVSYLKSGVVLEGTPIEALYQNELELQTDRDIMQYNAENARDTAINESIMMQAEADLSRWRGKVAKKASHQAAEQEPPHLPCSSQELPVFDPLTMALQKVSVPASHLFALGSDGLTDNTPEHLSNLCDRRLGCHSLHT